MGKPWTHSEYKAKEIYFKYFDDYFVKLFIKWFKIGHNYCPNIIKQIKDLEKIEREYFHVHRSRLH